MMRILLILVCAALVSGCNVFNTAGSSDYACPGMPKGVVCKSPRDVYKISDKEKVKNSKNRTGEMPTYVFATQPQDSSNLAPVPVLEQAQVMRIWVAPWVDRNKDLHWPGLVFTQIQPRQWHFGDQEFEGVEPPVPHKMFESAPQVPRQPDKTTSSAAMPKNEDEVLN